ncbi:hypothetical protein TRFO_02952 [Tritrichomonas foetus]|uniref:Uncharacterized protein n=1 Tax=Tritrichomonas foetus TaxID=1144522 RepID=A0A1J4KYQ8_9EUKA|nr:hypothetical protein TRFO_02952 [Tritrichomonas foetus]|eukprot:OHT14709.1 hypothetical protein TRFO_02952 [Tritrichomonas foetus]
MISVQKELENNPPDLKEVAPPFLEEIENVRFNLNEKTKRDNVKFYIKRLEDTIQTLEKAFSDRKKDDNDEILGNVIQSYSDLQNSAYFKAKTVLTSEMVTKIDNYFNRYIQLQKSAWNILNFKELQWKKQQIEYIGHFERNLSELLFIVQFKEKLASIADLIKNINKKEIIKPSAALSIFTKKPTIDPNEINIGKLIEVPTNKATEAELEMMKERMTAFSSVMVRFQQTSKPYDRIAELEAENNKLQEQSKDGWVTSQQYDILVAQNKELKESIERIRAKIDEVKLKLEQPQPTQTQKGKNTTKATVTQQQQKKKQPPKNDKKQSTEGEINTMDLQTKPVHNRNKKVTFPEEITNKKSGSSSFNLKIMTETDHERVENELPETPQTIRRKRGRPSKEVKEEKVETKVLEPEVKLEDDQEQTPESIEEPKPKQRRRTRSKSKAKETQQEIPEFTHTPKETEAQETATRKEKEQEEEQIQMTPEQTHTSGKLHGNNESSQKVPSPRRRRRSRR